MAESQLTHSKVRKISSTIVVPIILVIISLHIWVFVGLINVFMVPTW